MGSFVNVLIYRLPRKVSLLSRSHCTHCNIEIRYRDLIPIFSYFLLKGSCRNCGSDFSAYYAVNECSIALIFCIAFKFALLPIVICVSISAFIVVANIDVKHYVISHEMQLLLFLCGIAYNALNELDIYAILIRILICGVPILIAERIHQALRGYSGIGFGDIKLFFISGMFIKLDLIPYLYIISSIQGVLFYFILKKKIIPFGCCISLSMIFILLIG